ncbi:MAG: response regulator [Candidatus Riflebacteria bacterium]|nr:response regulator [Candidatus Riflebacteria bacterium]
MNKDRLFRVSLTWKVRIAFIFLFVLFCGLGIFSLTLLQQLENITKNIHNEATGFADLDKVSKTMTDERYLYASLILTESDEELSKIDKLLVKTREEFIQACKIYEEGIFFAESNQLFEKFLTLAEAYHLETDVVFDLALQGKNAQARTYMQTTANSSFREAFSCIGQLRQLNNRIATQAWKNANTVYGQGKIVLLIATIMVSIGTMLIARFMRLSIFRPILNLTGAITRLADWEMNVVIPEQNRSDELGEMANAIAALQITAIQQQKTSWIKAKLQEVTHEIQKSEQIEEFAATLLNRLAPILEAQVGAFYSFDILEESFNLSGRYGFTPRSGHPTHFRIGEGLIGQCAADKASITLTNLPPDYISITSGIVDGTPHELFIAPILASADKVLAVMEFATIKEIGPEQHDLLKELLPILGLNLQIIERNQRTKELLTKSQRQALELEKQAEQIFSDQYDLQNQHHELLKVNEELANKTAEIEATLEKLEEATKVKNIFLANMSHEIRTPMNAVIGMSHLCLKTELSDKQKDYVEKIQQAGFSLLEIINNVLDFSRIEDGNMKVRRSLFMVSELLDKTTLEFACRAKDKGLEFITQVDEGLPPSLYGDHLRISQILHQLLANAVKFTEKGRVELKIKILEHNDSQIKLRFEVADTGIGMTQKHLTYMFQPFRQADNSTTREFSGTGIGLALSKRLVEMMGGEIQAKSQHGLGTTFYFEVWCGLGAASTPQTISFSIEDFRALIVDDNPIDQQILTEQLTSIGLQVNVCASGTEAMVKIQEADSNDPFRLVFMDWQLPGGNGIDIIHQIENLETHNHKPAIILVTAFEIDDVRDQAELAGVKAFLPKPVTPSNLWSSLVKAFGSPILKPSLEETQKYSPRDLHGLRVLLVEDNDLNQQIAKELLQSVDIEVALANNGKIALEMLKSSPDPLPYDLIFMDIQMPIMDGHQATIEIRKDDRFKNLPIIALTANAMEDEKQQCLEEGMNGHISKPIEPPQLFRLLTNWVKRRPDTTSNSKSELDTKAGLRRVAGNRQLYANLLQRFAEGQSSAVELIRKALANGEKNTAERVAHTLKGVSGNIGATSLQSIAATLEKGLKAGKDLTAIETELAQCEEIFNKTIAAITLFTANTAGENAKKQNIAPATADLDPSSAARMLKHFHYLLAQSDGESEDYLEQNEAFLKALLGEDALTKLQNSLSQFDFDAALAHLQKTATERKIVI